MFDDQVNKTNPPTNLPVEPSDMFAGVEKDENTMPAPEKVPDALGAGLLKKKENSSPNVSAAPMVAPSLYEVKQPILGRILLFIFIAVLLGGAGFGGWYMYNKFIGNKTDSLSTVVPTTTEEQKPAVQTPVAVEEVLPVVTTNTVDAFATTSDVTAKMNNDKILFGEAVDSDKDGLDDVREKEIGSNPYNADTDGDGLSDGDEVIIWKTNPLNQDTDGDSYKDGEEVRNGYNPLGSGKLFNIPSGASTSTVTSTSKTTTTTKTLPVANTKK